MSEMNHIDHLLHDFLDGDLSTEARQTVQQHLEGCTACRESYAALQALHSRLAALPQSIAPPRDLWQSIEAQIKEVGVGAVKEIPEQAEYAPARAPRRIPRRTRWQRVGVAASIVLVASLAVFWAVDYFVEPSWEVAFLEEALPARQEQVRVGEWIETDAASRAVIEVGRIGEVEVSPESRVQLREAKMTDNRLLLAEGRIEARIWAPPRLFFVETPAALAVDLGCAYTLTVDSLGMSLLHVTSGYVELVREGRETLVPAGAMCRARPGYGPGTAFDQKASAALQDALVRYDFEQGGAEALSDILAEARATDGITLWQLFFRADADNRVGIYDRLVALIPPPEGVTRDGVLRNNPEMLDRWQRHLGLAVMSWKGYLKKKNKG